MPRENPFTGMVANMSPDNFALLSSAVAERRCREEVGFGTFAEAAAYKLHPPCPSCGNTATWRDGLEEGGTQHDFAQDVPRQRPLPHGVRHAQAGGERLHDHAPTSQSCQAMESV